MKVAIALFGDQISPRFGFSAEMLIATIEGNRVVDRQVIRVAQFRPGRLPEVLVSMGVERLICGGINQVFQSEFERLGVEVTWGVIGNAEEALAAMLSGTLVADQFICMGRGGLGRGMGLGRRGRQGSGVGGGGAGFGGGMGMSAGGPRRGRRMGLAGAYPESANDKSRSPQEMQSDQPSRTPKARIAPSACSLCGACEGMCPTRAITMGPTCAEVNEEDCMGCGMCVTACPTRAITLS